MRTRILALLFTLISFIVVSSAYAVPNLISYQGVLNDQEGVPLSTTVSMAFILYDAATDGNTLWSESQSVVVEGGLFNVKLGSVQQLPSSVFSSDTMYLGIQVGADAEMIPRQRLTPGPYVPSLALPIGTIMAWAKNLAGVPALENNWVECNGQTLNDTYSPLNGQVIPDMNGENRFLRGNATSGAVSGAEAHQHRSPLIRDIDSDTTFFGGWGRFTAAYNREWIHQGVRDSLNENIGFGSYIDKDTTVGTDRYWYYNTSEGDSKPPSYNVVWIMKVK